MNKEQLRKTAKAMVEKGKGILAGQKAFLAKCVTTIESFPPEKSIPGFSNCAKTSLIT